MPRSGHPGVVTGLGCPLCDGPCQHGWLLPQVPADYPFLDEEMVAAMQPPSEHDEAADAPEQPPARGRRRGQNRARHLEEDTARHPSEDRS